MIMFSSVNNKAFIDWNRIHHNRPTWPNDQKYP